jgi:hypothetical protein
MNEKIAVTRCGTNEKSKTVIIAVFGLQFHGYWSTGQNEHGDFLGKYTHGSM